MAELKTYQILIEDEQYDDQPDEQGNRRRIGSRIQYTTSYGEDEQKALEAYNKNFPTTAGRIRTEVVGIDPSFQEMMRTNTSSPNTPYFSQDTGRYYGMANPYAVATLPNTQNIDVNRARQTITPFTDQSGMQQGTPADILYGLRRMSPPPNYNLGSHMGSVQLPTTYDAQAMPSFPQGLDPYRVVEGPDGYQGQMDPGGFAPADPNILQGMPLTGMQGTAQTGTVRSLQQLSTQELQLGTQLKDYLLSLTGLDQLGGGGFPFGIQDTVSLLTPYADQSPTEKRRKREEMIRQLGITDEMFNSSDPAVLQNVISRLQGSNILNDSEFVDQSPAAELERRQQLEAIQQPQQEDTDELTMGAQVTPEDFNAAMQAIREVQAGGTASLPDSIIRLGMSDTTGNSPAAQLVRQFGDAQARSMPFEQATQRRQETLEQARLDLDTAAVNNALDIAGMQARSDDYRAQLGFASDQMQIQSTERINNANIRSAEMIAQASNQSNERIAEVSANASRDVAQINGLSQQQVALINTRSAKEVAEITGLNQREVERIKGDIQTRIAQATNLSKEDIARIQADAQTDVAQIQMQSAVNVATKNNLSAQLISEDSNQTQLQIAEAQRKAQAEVARQNRLSQENIAQLIYSEDAEALRVAEFEDLKEIERIRNDYAKELAQAIDISEEALAVNPEGVVKNMEQYIAEINARATKDFQDAQLAFEKEKYQAEIDAQPEQLEFQKELAQMQFQGGYETPEEFKAAQIEIGRGGLTQKEDESLRALLAAGGLTPEQRLDEIRAESRSQEMNSLMALLTNPQALGAFVTIISGELPFETVPTMGQLTEMTPSRIEYLQGALSALGIDPQTFIRMAQDVTPQAFQETGPFGQLSAMIS